ncbi:MAG: hypothetical protein N4A76_12280 [Firmicutes bacterium]|jgi:hypothetical protein|nr:hypothetical protein [Bacillota bacterium]
MKILFYSRDPGGANIIASIVSLGDFEEYDYDLLGKDMALEKYNEFNLIGQDIETCIENLSYENIRRFLIESNYDVVFTSTSANDMIDKYLWDIGKDIGIKTCCILDQWMNYSVRFTEKGIRNNYKNINNQDLKYVPDYIFCMDDYSKEKLIDIGIKSARVKIVGHPYFEYLKHNFSNSFLQEGDDFKVLFASEPISQNYEFDDFGYNELTVLKDVVEELRSIANKNKKNIYLTIKLHPREILKVYHNEIKSDKYLKVNVEKEIPSKELIKTCNLVIGMTSMFLFESYMLGTKTLSVQTGLNKESTFLFDIMGLDFTIRDKVKLNKILENIIIHNLYDDVVYDMDNLTIDSVKRITKVLEGII